MSCSQTISQTSYEIEVDEATSIDNFESEVVKEVVQKAYSDNEKAFIVTKNIDGIDIELKHIPVELLALKELKKKAKFSKIELDSVIKTYGEVLYYDIRFTSKMENIYSAIYKKHKAEEVNSFLSDHFIKNIKLDGKIFPSVYHYNNTMGVLPGFSFFIGFDKNLIQSTSKLTVTKSIISNKVEIDLSPR